MASRLVWVLVFVLVVAPLTSAESAQATPIDYTIGATILAGGGIDPIHLDGASLLITLHADTADPPVGITDGPVTTDARYAPRSGSLVITNRPSGASDLTIPYTPELITVNAYLQSSGLLLGVDAFHIQGSTINGIPGASQVSMSTMEFSWNDQSYFAGTGAGELPAFEGAADRVEFIFVLGQPALYLVGGASIAAEVPEPENALLGALAILASSRARRSKARRARPGKAASACRPSCAGPA